MTDEGQIWCTKADPRYMLTCQILSGSLYSVVLCWRKPPIFAVFGLRHLVLSPIGNSLTQLNTGAQLQSFPYPMASKLFLYSNAFMAKPGAQTLTFKSVTDKQTVKQTKLECGQVPNVMVALPNTGGALCSTPQSLADAHYWNAVQ